MHPILGACPVCGETLAVTRLHCRNCDTTIEGQFAAGAFDRLSPEQLAFAETFVRCDGKLNSMAIEIGLSYPTLRARLNELIQAMGGPLGLEAPTPTAGIGDEERRQILDDVATGKLSSEAAVKLLHGS